MTHERVAGSFRDPAGFVFSRGGTLYRQVNVSFRPNYEHLMRSGLYESLVKDGLLISHEEVDAAQAATEEAFAVLRPEMVSFVSYPYEWCFGQLKDAALATLAIQSRALDFGMSLRDASAYNIQFVRGKPTLIDTLSFEVLREGMPWVAYRQFCQHFLAPLALMAFRDARLGQLLRVHIDGVPLDLASALLPRRTRFRPGLGMHVHAHARSQRRHARPSAGGPKRTRPLGARALRGIISSLESAVGKLRWRPGESAWASYYESGINYSDRAFDHKAELVAGFLDRVAPATVWDLGANTGFFGRIAMARGAEAVCFDIDPACVEANYRQTRAQNETGLLPLVLDLANPSPAIGWGLSERRSLRDRGPANLALALALVHHLAIGNNVPLESVAEELRALCSWLIVEFVPKSDDRVQMLLASREDVFPGYTQEGFERAFAGPFATEARERVRDSERTLYLMRGR